MDESYELLLSVPRSHKLVLRGSRVEQRKGQDADIYEYDELDANGCCVAQYEIKDAMSIYPPFKRIVTWKKIHE